MKRIIFTLTVLSVFISSCSKDDNKAKKTRLKTYTHDYYARIPAALDKYTIEYNSANKISKIIHENNGALYKTTYCVYTAANKLDSVVTKYTSGGIYAYKVIWTGNKITRYDDIDLTYNSDGLIDKKIYADGSYFRNEYIADSIFLYNKPVGGSEYLQTRYLLSSSIKNPFLISGFEAEAYFAGNLLYYYNSFNALLPTIEIKYLGYLNNKDYTFEGDFNGYPLQRNDLTNSIDENRSKETFTYEEF
ncbi:MAG: hypothetical protein IPM95_14110 [Sphingobacteriales bacterium]|nr:hypothetical protein [Sphingobacteriales bacterium]